MNKHNLLRLTTLDKCLRDKNKEYKFEDLLKACNRALGNYDGSTVSERTLKSDLAALQDTPYNAELEDLRDGHAKIYRYADLEFTITEKILPDGFKSALQEMSETLDIIGETPQTVWIKNMLNEHLQGRPAGNSQNIQFQNNPDLKGTEHFDELMGAVVAKQTLRITYQPYDKKPYSFVFHPYLLKQFNDRWFVIGREDGREKLSNLAIDRIVKVGESKAEFKDTDTDWEEYFDDIIGVTVPEGKVETIVLKVAKKRYNYIASKPIHQTQTELHQKEDEEHKYIRLKLKINKELISKLLSFGADVEVTEPAELREKMRQETERMAKAYGE